MLNALHYFIKTKNKENMNNIVFFGPENVGKSTMIGYLYCQSLGPQQYEQETNRIKATLGSRYRRDRKYSYFVDNAKDEREKQGQDNNDKKSGTGTSKYFHLKASLANNKEILFIDTPGAPEYLQQRTQGISMASIGVFALEIKQLISDTDDADSYRYFNKFFSTWFLWKKMSGLKNSIIILTKYDRCAGKDDFEDAKSCLSLLLGANEIKETLIIPTSVTVEMIEGKEVGKDINVTTKLMEDWYKGPCLMDALVEKCKVVDKENSDMPLLMFHVKDYPKYEQSKLSQWKILQGMISSRDKVKIAPVELKDKSVKIDDKFTSMEAIIESISGYNFDGKDGEYDDTAYSGSISDIKFIFTGDRKYSILPTSIAVKPDEEVLMGNCITVEIQKEDCSEEEWSEIIGIYPKKQLSMLWFSRIIHVSLTKSIESIQLDLFRLTFLVSGNKVALPKRKLHQQTVMLQLHLEHTLDGIKKEKIGLTTAVRAKVTDIY